MPKIIQIAVETATDQTDSTLYALCDDGRVFKKYKIGYGQEEHSWELIEAIPFERWQEPKP